MTVGRAVDLFAATFGRGPLVVASAPGRVNLIGEHTDYCGGEVLPIAIDQRTWVAMAPGTTGRSRAVSLGRGGAKVFDVDRSRPAGGWWDYAHGALRELRAAGAGVGPVDLAVVSDVPSGAGLSSSAAFEVATALAGLALSGGLPAGWEAEVRLVAHRAETDFVGVPCGIMDQTASACATHGHALHLWCDTGRVEHVPFARSVLIVDTATPRQLRGSAFNDRQASCARALGALRLLHPSLRHLAHATLEQLDAAALGDEDRRRARHVITETQRVGAFVHALAAGEPLGSLLAASHASLRTDYECSSAELDWTVEFATAIAGVEGARLTGAGWGGCAIAIGPDDALRAVAGAIPVPFERRFQRRPRTWRTPASGGARIEDVN